MIGKPGGFGRHVTDEQMEEWEKVPVEERLRRLEEWNEFLDLVLDDETRACREAFRRGEI